MFRLGLATLVWSLFWVGLMGRAFFSSNQILPFYSGILVRTSGTLEEIEVRTDYVNDNITSHAVTKTFRIGLKLVDDAGAPFSAEVFTPAFVVVIPARDQVDGTKKVTLLPGALLSGVPYHVAAQLYVPGAVSGTWAPLFAPEIGAGYRFSIVDSNADSGVVLWSNTVEMIRSFAVATIPEVKSFQARIMGTVARRDQVGQPSSTENEQIHFDVTITGQRSGAIPLVKSRLTIPIALDNHNPVNGAAYVLIDQMIEMQPVAQIDSTDSYSIQLVLSHMGSDAIEKLHQTVLLGEQRLLHFNGTLKIGAVAVTMSALNNEPTADGTLENVGEKTSLAFLQNGAALVANPAFTLQSGPLLTVLLAIDGTATSTDSVAVLGPDSPAKGTLNGVAYELGEITLDGAGIHVSDGAVRLPTGMGVAPAPNIRRQRDLFPFGAAELNADLSPTGIIELKPSVFDAAFVYVSHEDLPLVFKSTGISWNVAAGTFLVHRADTIHVRREETLVLETLPLTVETLIAKLRPSNDGYLAAPGTGVGVDVVMRTDARGRAMIDEAMIDLPASQFKPHFPPDITIQWTEPGQLLIEAGTVNTTKSRLPGAKDTSFGSQRGSPPLTLLGGLNSFSFAPEGGIWNFTADGGLHAVGAVVSGAFHWWARSATEFGQTAGEFTTGAAYMPGIALRSATAATSLNFRPGELLLSGQGKPGDATYRERPLTPSYALGLADYAGLNLRSSGPGGQTATSLFGDTTLGPYPLAAVTKFYLRDAGVSGIQVADRAFFGAAGRSLTLYGFHLSITDYQLSYLESVQQDSRIPGTVDVPGVRGKPGFSQPFTKLAFNSQGQPGELTLSKKAALEHSLSYWHAHFHPLNAEFIAKPADAKQVALVFGAEVLLPGVLKTPVRGGIGFFPAGRLVAAKDGIPGVNSRLKPPKLVELHGPGSAAKSTIPGFSVHPGTDFYFNDPTAESAPDDGFIAFAGTMDVPFFEDLKVHVLARADTGTTVIRAGWTENKKDFWSDRNFDTGNIGFPIIKHNPTNYGYAEYVDEAEPPKFDYYNEHDNGHTNRNIYNPIARQSWLDFVDFALPIRWDPTRRRFASTVPEERDFLILSTQRVLQQLTPSGAEIRFGLQFNKLPRLSPTSLVIDDKEATDEVLKFIPGGRDLVAAESVLKDLMDGNSDKVVDRGVDLALDHFLDYLLSTQGPLQNVTSAAGAAAAIGVPKSPSFEKIRDQLTDQLSGVVGSLKDANSVVGQLSQALGVLDGGIQVADTLLKKDGDGRRGGFIDDAVNLAASVGLPADDLKKVTRSITSEINGELAPTLDEIQRTIDEVQSLEKSAKSLVDDVREVTQGALAAANVAGKLPDEVLGAMQRYFAKAHDPTGLYLAEMDPVQLRTELKQKAREILSDSEFLGQVKQTVSDAVQPLGDEYHGMFQEVFGILNNVVRSVLEELDNQVVDHLNEDVGRANRAIGSFNKTLEMSKAEGNATILGDSIDHAHLTVTLGLHVPDNVSLLGTLDFRRLHGSQGLPPCVKGSADGRMQITMAAHGEAGFGAGPSGHLDLHGQYTLDAHGKPLALSGGLTLGAEVHVDIVGLKKADFEFAFGPGDNYVRAEGEGSIYIFNVHAKAFFGRTCDPDLVRWLDPQIEELFEKLRRPKVDESNPLIGFYILADGDVLLNRILDIPDSLLTLKASGGAGNFIFCTPDLTSIIPGMHWRMGLDVRVGVVEAGAELVALGGLEPIPLLRSFPDGLARVGESFLKDPLHSLKGSIVAHFTPKVEAGPFSWSQTFDFTASGSYIPSLAVPPGLFLINKLSF